MKIRSVDTSFRLFLSSSVSKSNSATIVIFLLLICLIFFILLLHLLYRFFCKLTLSILKIKISSLSLLFFIFFLIVIILSPILNNLCFSFSRLFWLFFLLFLRSCTSNYSFMCLLDGLLLLNGFFLAFLLLLSLSLFLLCLFSSSFFLFSLFLLSSCFCFFSFLLSSLLFSCCSGSLIIFFWLLFLLFRGLRLLLLFLSWSSTLYLSICLQDLLNSFCCVDPGCRCLVYFLQENIRIFTFLPSDNFNRSHINFFLKTHLSKI